ncbi:putative oxidoreductase [Biscogniauxia marginata]|nr:putative oxidoreductase [Biscogniauxia marginata]
MSSSVPLDQLPEASKQASLRVIDLHELESGSASEHASLLQASIEDGFFYLKLVDTPERPVQKYAERIFRLSEEIFEQDPAVKDLFDVDKISHNKTNGYKPRGRNIVSKDGTRDGFESWVLPRNGLFQLGNDSFPHPPVVAIGMNSLKSFITELGSAAQTIFRSLSASLSLQPGQRFEDFHNPSNPASDILRLLKYHADGRIGNVPQTPHTDLGSLTFLFTSTPGLQVLPVNVQSPIGTPPTEADWRYVLPIEGYAIVNIGDCMTKMTNGLLKSVLHRVGPLPGHPMPERYSFAYLMRPEDSTPLCVLESPLIPAPQKDEVYVTSGEWIQSKFKALRGVHDSKNGDRILTGGRGVLV